MLTTVGRMVKHSVRAKGKAPPNRGAFSWKTRRRKLESQSQLRLERSAPGLRSDRTERSNSDVGVRNGDLGMVQNVCGINPQGNLFGFRDLERLLSIGVK